MGAITTSHTLTTATASMAFPDFPLCTQSYGLTWRRNVLARGPIACIQASLPLEDGCCQSLDSFKHSLDVRDIARHVPTDPAELISLCERCNASAAAYPALRTTIGELCTSPQHLTASDFAVPFSMRTSKLDRFLSVLTQHENLSLANDADSGCDVASSCVVSTPALQGAPEDIGGRLLVPHVSAQCCEGGLRPLAKFSFSALHDTAPDAVIAQFCAACGRSGSMLVKLATEGLCHKSGVVV